MRIPLPEGLNPGRGGGGPGGHGGGGGGQCPPIPGGNPAGGEPVDLSSGLQVLQATDIAIAGPRGRIAIDRVYRSGTNNRGSFGIGMQFLYDYALNNGNPVGAQSISLITPDGNQFLFSRQPDGSLTNTSIPFLLGAVLTINGDGTSQLRWQDGTVYRFTTDFGPSRLVSITDRNGNQVSLTRNPSAKAQITAITDPVGRRLDLTWDASNRITSVTDPIGRIVTYTYNAAGSLE